MSYWTEEFPAWIICMTYGWLSVFLIFQLASQIDNIDVYEPLRGGYATSSTLNQVSLDWKRQPFVDVKVFERGDDVSACPEDYPETVMSRTFFGSELGCDCIDVSSRWVDNAGQMIHGKRCDKNQTVYGCEESPPIPPIILNKFNGLSICGKTGGDPFLFVERPDYSTGKCRDGFVPCSNYTSAENTVCYGEAMNPDEVCPITRFDFSKSTKPSFNLGDGASLVSQPFGDLHLHFTKDADALPAAPIKVETQMCADPQYQEQASAHELEMQSDISCPRVQFEAPPYSRIYQEVGSVFQISEYDLTEQSVLRLFLNGLPHYISRYEDRDAESETMFKPWSRQTFPWRLECEEKLPRAEAYEQIFMRPFSSHSDFSRDSYRIGIMWIRGLSIPFFFLFVFFGGLPGCCGVAFVALFMNVLGHILLRLVMYFVILFFILRMGSTMASLGAQKQALKTIEEYRDILQDCSHESTHIDVDYHRRHFDLYFKELNATYLLMWGIVCQYIAEIVLFVFIEYKPTGSCECKQVKENLTCCREEFIRFLEYYKVLN